MAEYIWLWDRPTSQFVLNWQLMDIENAGLRANQDTRQIEVFHRVGADHFFTFFEYHDGEFVRDCFFHPAQVDKNHFCTPDG